MESVQGGIEWDKAMEKGEKIQINQYISNIVKNTQTMHKVLNPVLPKKTIEQIFSEVFRFLN